MEGIDAAQVVAQLRRADLYDQRGGIGRRIPMGLEVSVRTVLRDIDELSAAGVPVDAHRGSNGGFELMGGFRGGLAGDAGLDGLRAGGRTATFVLVSPATSAADVLSLGPELEVIAPPAFRARVRALAAETACIYDAGACPGADPTRFGP